MTQQNANATQSPIVAKIWQRFQEVEFTPDFGPEGSRLLIALYRKLAAEGRPIAAHEVAELAASLDVSLEETAALVEGTAERDDEGAVRGIVGWERSRSSGLFAAIEDWHVLSPERVRQGFSARMLRPRGRRAKRRW